MSPSPSAQAPLPWAFSGSSEGRKKVDGARRRDALSINSPNKKFLVECSINSAFARLFQRQKRHRKHRLALDPDNMAGSQLKRLKASLREQGIVGPQQSKKQKRKNAQEERGRNEKRLQRGAVLSGIREQFNPFDLKHAARGPKFQVTSNAPPVGSAKSIQGRPGQAKAASEEKRRNTLLIDMQRRNKVGGIRDRRFGEDDPDMAMEDKMLERFAMEKQRSHKKSSLFDLEEDDDAVGDFTHGGKTLTFEDEGPVDDFDEDDLDSGAESDGSLRSKQRRKRLRALAGEGGDEESQDEQPERKKTKKEVMEEIIAKSKMHKYERQAAKEDDTDMRELLDKELPDIQMLLAANKNSAKRNDDATASSIAGVQRDAFDKNFDLQVKKLAQDRRAKPADRTKTDEEVIEEESKRLKELEDKRQRRMRGESVSDSDEDSEDEKKGKKKVEEEDDAEDDETFGLGGGIKTRPTATELGFDDEDDFVIEDDLVASGSELDLAESDEDEEEGSESEDDSDGDVVEDEDDEFTKGLLNEEESRNPVFKASTAKPSEIEQGDDDGLPFTFNCPQTVDELLAITTKYPHQHTPKIVQRIRALYHPKLDSKNKEKLGNFASALVDYIASPWDAESSAPFQVIESIVRHIHSLSKMFPIEISKQFRQHIEEMEEERPLALEVADLVLLSAISTIYPTSDHFHQVVTPAMLAIGRYLGQKVPQNLGHFATGTYLSILSLQYQQMSKRYVPEVLNFTLNTLCALAPTESTKQLGEFPIHSPPAGARLEKATSATLRKLRFEDCVTETGTKKQLHELQVAIVSTNLQVIDAAADLWSGKEAFIETFDQAASTIHHLKSKSCRAHIPASLNTQCEKLETKLNRMLRLSQVSRRPLELHHHRPLAIKTFIPKFEDTFDPDKHYDPDRERAELAKLKKEHKRERKGAMRELRKDANFMAREKLRVKKAKDEAYEKKFKRLVAEIQSEEGRETNAYEREKDARKRARNK